MPEALGRNLVPMLSVGAILVVAAAFHAGGSYGIRLLTVAGIYALLAIGYQLVFGFVGALSLAQGAFFGIGAYATGIAATRLGLDATITLPIAILLPTMLAAIVAAPVLRLESHYFALATLGLAQLALLVGINAESVTGGANGLPGVPGLALLGFAVPRGWPMLLAVWSAVALCAWLAWRWTSGQRALVFRLLREDPIAAEALGIDAGRLRILAFLFAAACAGLAGALHVHLIGVVSPEVLEFPVMVACLSMVVIGGRARVAGAVLGAVLLVHLPEYLRGIGAWYMVAYGALLLAVVVFAPEGIVGVLSRRRTLAPPLPDQGGRGDRARQAPFPSPLAGAGRGGGKVRELATLRGVTKRFGGVTALDGIDLAIAPGDLLGVIGPNGSGKTTLINVLSGLYRADAGSILTAPGLVVARGFQAPRLLDDESVLANVALGAHARRDARDVARHWLDRLDLAALADRACGTLPGGLRRKVEIARALAGAPHLLLLDEPAAGLTPAEQDDLGRTLAMLRGEGLTIVVVEHEVAFLVRLCSRLACLVEGRVVAEGSPDQVVRDERVIDAYLGSSWRGAAA